MAASCCASSEMSRSSCCFDCRTDDFCHIEDCEIMKKVEQSDIQKPEVRKLEDAEDKEAT